MNETGLIQKLNLCKPNQPRKIGTNILVQSLTVCFLIQNQMNERNVFFLVTKQFLT